MPCLPCSACMLCHSSNLEPVNAHSLKQEPGKHPKFFQSHISIQSETWYFSLRCSFCLSFLGWGLLSSFLSTVPILWFQMGEEVIHFLLSLSASALGRGEKNTNQAQTFCNFPIQLILLMSDSYTKSWTTSNILNTSYRKFSIIIKTPCETA